MLQKRDNFSLYIHIPFCFHKCPYCDFNTYATPAAPEESYIIALLSELKSYAVQEKWGSKEIQTIFFGGGTPSMFTTKGIKQIIDSALSLFKHESNIEISLEANPSSITYDYAMGLFDAGINRISLGAQSFHQNTLKLLGRDHTPKDINSAVSNAYEAGIKNISVDLIYGVPGQTLSEISDDLEDAFNLPINHISAYSLTFETGTPFYQSLKRGTLIPLPDEIVIEMMDQIESIAFKNQFHRYEISNYSRESFESKHNCAYWNGDSYLGIGAGAHSFLLSNTLSTGLRWSNMSIPAEYIKKLNSKQGVVSWIDQLTAEALSFEFFFLGLRKIKGVSFNEFIMRFGESLLLRYKDSLNSLESEGFLTRTENGYSLSRNGVHLCDSVMERITLS